MDVKADVERWLDELLGMRVRVSRRRLEDSGASRLRRYDGWLVGGLGVDVVLLSPREGEANPPPSEIARDMACALGADGRSVAFCTESLSAVHRSRLIRLRVPFVVPGRQLYLPFLGLALREEGTKAACRWLGTTAQHLLLYALSGGACRALSASDARRIAGCARATLFRAVHELESFGLIRRRCGIVFADNLADVVRERRPRLKDGPIRDQLLEALYGADEDILRGLPC